jgi:hypothetical protein
MKQIPLILFFACCQQWAFTQSVGIGTATPNASAQLEVNSTTKGFLPPRMTATERDAITTPAKGLMVFATTDSSYYFFDGVWKRLAPANETWGLQGNTSIDTDLHFLGNVDTRPLRFRIGNVRRMELDNDGRLQLINQFENVFIGQNVAPNNSGPNAGRRNSFFGFEAGKANTTGSANLFAGASSGLENTSGALNVFLGSRSGWINTTGSANTFVGASAGLFTSTGAYNTFVGAQSGDGNKFGSSNTTIGFYAQTGIQGAVVDNATAIGANARADCSNCLVLGSVKDINLATSSVHVGIGTTHPQFPLDLAGRMRIRSMGAGANTAGLWLNNSNNTLAKGFVGMFDDTRMGFYMDGPGGWGLTMNDAGNVGVVGNVTAAGFVSPSDARFKQNIRPLHNATATLLQLQGKAYHWRHDDALPYRFDDKEQMGFIAQEVEKVLPQLVTTDEKGYKTVNYIQVIPLLTEAVKEQEQKMAQQQKQLEVLQQRLAALEKRLPQ